MGSTSDLPIMQEAIDILKGFDIEVEVDIVSAHRTPEKLFDYGKNAHKRGFTVIIAGAGGAAHSTRNDCLTFTFTCYWGSCKSRNSIDGWDSVLSIFKCLEEFLLLQLLWMVLKTQVFLAAQIIGTIDLVFWIK